MDIDVEIFEPSLKTKKVKESEFFNVILVQNDKVTSNTLFSDYDLAVHNFINTIKEFADIPIDNEILAVAIDKKFFYISHGSICISLPNIKV